MGLFSKKSPCPICGGKISFFLPMKIEGECICDDCMTKIDMQDDIKNSLTLQQFRDYLAYYEQNKILKSRFVISQKIDFGCFDTKMVFDFENKLFCMNKAPDKTIFEGAQLEYFTIKEDNAILFEGSPDGLKRYESTIPQRVMTLAPQIAQFMMNKRLIETMEKMNDDDNDNPRYHNNNMDIPEPFHSFNVELHMKHPYWKVITCDMTGPVFSNTYPDANDYLDTYNQNVEMMEQLSAALMGVAFPEGKTINMAMANTASAVYSGAATAVQSGGDSIEEIKKYKGLMDDGIITREEFDAKKKKLLGI